MCTLYDQSKVPQQFVSKVLCVLALREVTKRLNDFNLPWQAYLSEMLKYTEFEAEARHLGNDLLPPEGKTLAAQEGARLPFTPAMLGQDSPRVPYDEESDVHSSRGSSPEPLSADHEHLARALLLASQTRMVFSKAQRNGYVHLHNDSCDTAYGAKAHCIVVIKHSNASPCSALEAMREKGQLDWCPRCIAFWPKGLDDALNI